MKKIYFFLFALIILHCRPAYSQYLHESLSLFNNLRPELKDSENLLLGFHTYTNFENKISDPKSLNHYELASRFRIFKDRKFFRNMELGLGMGGFFAFRNCPYDTVVSMGNVTVYEKDADAFGGEILYPSYNFHYTFGMPNRTRFTFSYLHRYLIISRNIELPVKYSSGHDFSFLVDVHKLVIQLLWRCHYIASCRSYTDTTEGRNYTLPGNIRSHFLCTFSYSDSIEKKLFLKQYLSGFFLIHTDNIASTPFDTMHTNAIIFGMLANYGHFTLNPEYSANILNFYDARDKLSPVKFRSFSLLAAYRFRNLKSEIGFTRTRYFYPTMATIQPEKSEWNYFLINLGLEYFF